MCQCVLGHRLRACVAEQMLKETYYSGKRDLLYANTLSCVAGEMLASFDARAHLRKHAAGEQLDWLQETLVIKISTKRAMKKLFFKRKKNVNKHPAGEQLDWLQETLVCV